MIDYRKTRTHAVTTPKLCQDRKVAAIRDACNRRGLRVAFVKGVALTVSLFFKFVNRSSVDLQRTFQIALYNS
jgi:hypothetical protein